MVKSTLPLPLRWPLAPRDHPNRGCRSPAGFLTLSLNFHASLKGENSVLPSHFPKKQSDIVIWVTNQWVQLRRTNSEGWFMSEGH